MKKFFYATFPLVFFGLALCDMKKTQEKQYDGPYVIYRNDKLYVKYVFEDSSTKRVQVDSMSLSEKAGLSLTVATDEPGKKFTVRLKKELNNEKNEFSKVSKQFIVSDIEGNFAAFRKLLQANAIIDSNFNWTFGDGHLVLTGDFFDRGNQQTEVLWLIYSLEEKAKDTGGHVHFILGNHEIMNMNGDLRYLHGKYLENAGLLKEDYLTLYSEHSELGRWLRTKNIVEKIGNILYTHGGISAEVNSLDISVSKINKLSRPYYPDTTLKYDDDNIAVLYSDWGPFWYRGYYAGSQKATSQQIDSTLSIYKVKHIATGHTVVADTISILFNGKVINTDVHHAKGHSEGLLIEGGKFYRATAKGEKFLIL